MHNEWPGVISRDLASFWWNDHCGEECKHAGTHVSHTKHDHILPHTTYMAPVYLLGTAKFFFYPLVKLWPGSGQTLKTQKYGPPPMPTHETTSDPLYNLVQPISEGSDQRGPTFKSLTRPWSFGKKSRNGASKSRNGPSIRSTSCTYY